MNKCFVIQPFDNGKYDQRFKDTFAPAIKKADLEPYRIDRDPNVRIPIDEIEQGIRDAAICFAEISTDNPNVWYELGYAFAHGKDVVMVSSDERVGSFPFDIRHRSVTQYKTGSKSDFESLETTITMKLKALAATTKKVTTLIDTPVVEQEGLTSHEIALLLLTGESQFTSEDAPGVYSLKDGMSKAGYTEIATGVALKLLERKGLMSTNVSSDWSNNQYLACWLTEKGEDWILTNQDKLVFRKDQLNKPEDDDLPF